MKLNKDAIDKIINLCELWGGHKEDTKLRQALNYLNFDAQQTIDNNQQQRVILTLKT